MTDKLSRHLGSIADDPLPAGFRMPPPPPSPRGPVWRKRMLRPAAVIAVFGALLFAVWWNRPASRPQSVATRTTPPPASPVPPAIQDKPDANMETGPESALAAVQARVRAKEQENARLQAVLKEAQLDAEKRNLEEQIRLVQASAAAQPSTTAIETPQVTVPVAKAPQPTRVVAEPPARTTPRRLPVRACPPDTCLELAGVNLP